MFSAQLNYALLALLELAHAYPQKLGSLAIARARKIPRPYLHQILLGLKKQKLVASLRGAEGGYTLTRSPEKITTSDVMKIFGGLHFGKGIKSEALSEFWNELENKVETLLKKTSLADLAQKEIFLRKGGDFQI